MVEYFRCLSLYFKERKMTGCHEMKTLRCILRLKASSNKWGDFITIPIEKTRKDWRHVSVPRQDVRSNYLA